VIYQETSIWQTALMPREEDTYAAQRARLRASYDDFWSKGCDLAAQIAKDVPELTLHDERHFDALWLRADQILGNSEPLSPVEAFVLGGAILLHDAANSVAAYPEGIREIERSAEWRDEVADQLRRAGADVISDDAIDSAPASVRKIALFQTLRHLHAKRAESLANVTLKNPSTNSTVSLIQDDRIRTHLSRVIGLVAASHHWNIQEIPHRLPKIMGVPAGFPQQWTIRPIRLACLLRCSDATQLDQSRAPDYLYALLDLKGLSESHWRAQNRLLAPVIDPDDPAALIFTSSREFGAEDAEAWWIAHDAIQVANKELQDSYSLLRDLRQSPFSVSRVRDAESPDRLSKHVVVEGWRPVNAEVRVSNVEAVVKMFGGQQLYGDDYLVPLREAIQNSADAIRRRREMPTESNYLGEITVRMKHKDQNIVLEIEDDGIGMSEAVLTGPLVDFGSSYFGSTIAKAERPGLLARSRKRTGRYGIGFFSMFDVASSLEVTSRPFETATSDFKTLSFRSGFSLRPILLSGRSDLGPLVSTQLRLIIPHDKFDRMMIIRARYDERSELDLASAVALCCPMLDCDVYVQSEGQERILVHSRYWHEQDREEWLDKCLILELRNSRDVWTEVARVIKNMEFVDPKRMDAGLAAINLGNEFLGLKTVGGLKVTAGARQSSFEIEFVGCLDFESAGPRRTAHAVGVLPRIRNWATRQASKLATQKLSIREAHEAAVRIAHFGGDPTEVVRLLLNRSEISLDEVCKYIYNQPLYISLRDRSYSGDNEWSITQISVGPQDLEYTPTSKEIVFTVPVLEAPLSRWEAYEAFYYYRPDHVDEEVTLISCLEAAVSRAHGMLRTRLIGEMVIGRYVGPSSERDGVLHDSEIIIPCLEVSVAPI